MWDSILYVWFLFFLRKSIHIRYKDWKKVNILLAAKSTKKEEEKVSWELQKAIEGGLVFLFSRAPSPGDAG